MKKNKLGLAITAATLSAFMLTGCGGSSSSDNDDVDAPEVTREHDEREFVLPATTSFDPLEGAVAYHGSYEGIQGPAVYTAEFPATGWNGGLIMYTHGYAGEGATVPTTVPNAAFRQTALAAGYAWAASSYSANFYDVRAGIEDTNKLALELRDYLAADWSVDHGEIERLLISGVSMGGHIAAAAVERENIERARYPVEYAGAMPLCQAEQNQFQWLGDYNRVAQELAGFGSIPYEFFETLRPAIVASLFEVNESGVPTWVPANENGQRLLDVATILTGGERPIFREFGFRNSTWQGAVLGTGGRDGTINGILAKDAYGNESVTYRWTTDAEPTAEEIAFNESIARVSADPDANPPRNDGVRWLPEVQGDFSVPVLTMHTLGDFYVPFRHQQLYRERAIANGNEDLLVQRAIRAPSHCDFSGTEIIAALTDFLAWVELGEKPDGDEVLDPEVVAAADYGCQFTNNALSAGRGTLPACPDVVE